MGTTTDALSRFQQDQLNQIVNGSELRPLLLDPEPCTPVENYVFLVSLVLDTMTLEKEVSGCFVPAGTPRVLESLRNLIRQF